MSFRSDIQLLSPRGLRWLMDGVPGAVLGGFVYAMWAAYVNWGAGAHLALRAAGLHWGLSVFLTLCGTSVMRFCFGSSPGVSRSAIQAFFGGLSFTYFVLLLVHHMAGTPYIFLTLVAGVLPNCIFCFVYVSLLVKTSTKKTVLT